MLSLIAVIVTPIHPALYTTLMTIPAPVIAVGAIAIARIPIGTVIAVAVSAAVISTVIAVGVSAAVISTAICTPLNSAVDASNAPG